jgi:hypothetical protein
LQQYGTDSYTEATFGGRLFMLLKYDRSYQDLVVPRKTEKGTPLTKEQLVERTNPHFSSNVFEKLSEYQGGHFITDEPLGNVVDPGGKRTGLSPPSSLAHSNDFELIRTNDVPYSTTSSHKRKKMSARPHSGEFLRKRMPFIFCLFAH